MTRAAETITQRVVKNARRQGVTVYERHQWGSKYQQVYTYRRWTRPTHQPADTVVQHITVTLDTGPLTGDFFRDLRKVEFIGYQRFASGMSYNFLVDMTTGEVGVGMPLDAKGTHTVNDKGVPGFSYDQNIMARAIAVLGMADTKLRWRAKRSIVRLLVAMMEEGAITDHFDYVPHSLFAAKDCPCDSTRSQMPKLRRRAMRRYKRRQRRRNRRA